MHKGEQNQNQEQPLGGSVKGRLEENDLQPWLCGFVPLVSVVAFFLILVCYGVSLNLKSFHWDLVKKNLSQTNSLPETHEKFPTVALQQIPFNTPGKITNSEPLNVEKHIDGLTKELTVRFFWGSSAVTFAFLCVCTICVSFRTFKESFRPKKRGIAFWIAGISAACLFAYCFHWGDKTSLSGGAGPDELLDAIQNPAKFTMDPLPPGPIPKIRELVGGLTAVAFASVLSTALGASFLLKGMKTKTDSPDDADYFENQVSKGFTLLQLTALALVAGVMEVYFLFNVASYHEELVLQNDIQYFARSAATATGLIYSGMLAAIFLPLAVAQRSLGRRILQKYEAVLDKDKRKRLREMTQNDLTALPAIKAGLAVLSPLLISFFTKLLSSIAEHP
jgi:hypothetical protein